MQGEDTNRKRWRGQKLEPKLGNLRNEEPEATNLKCEGSRGNTGVDKMGEKHGGSTDRPVTSKGNTHCMSTKGNEETAHRRETQLNLMSMTRRGEPNLNTLT